MNNKEINIAIAKLRGWIFKPKEYGWSFAKIVHSGPWTKYDDDDDDDIPYPDYCSDANATHDIIASFTRGEERLYILNLYEIVGGNMDDAVVANRKEKALAILKTLQKK
jgi:hypothetical protein